MQRPVRTFGLSRLAAIAATATFTTAVLSTTALAQQRPQAGQRPIRQASASAGTTGKPTRPLPRTMTTDPRLEAVLSTWGRRSGSIKKLSGTHRRFIYDPSSGTERRSAGDFAFASPDKGMLTVKPNPVDENAKSRKKTPKNEPYEVISDDPETWVCDGTQILQFEVSLGERQYSRIEIPPSMRGRNIIQGPMPFLFGVSGPELKKRYRMEIGPRHTWKEGTQTGGVHIVAYPLRKVDAQTWQKADVLLDGRTFLPKAIRMLDGLDAYASETVYLFDGATMKVNQVKWPWSKDPFKPSTRGWKLIANHEPGEAEMGRMAPPK